MEWQDAREDIEALLTIACDEWLSLKERQAAREVHNQMLTERRAGRHRHLQRLAAHMDRVAEIDARIALLEITPHAPDRDKYLHRLEEVRRHLILQKQNLDSSL